MYSEGRPFHIGGLSETLRPVIIFNFLEQPWTSGENNFYANDILYLNLCVNCIKYLYTTVFNYYISVYGGGVKILLVNFKSVAGSGF